MFSLWAIMYRKLSYQTQNQINKSYSFNILGWHIARIIWPGIAQHSKWYTKQKASRYRLLWTFRYKLMQAVITMMHVDKKVRVDQLSNMMNSNRNTSLGPTGTSTNARLSRKLG